MVGFRYRIVRRRRRRRIRFRFTNWKFKGSGGGANIVRDTDVIGVWTKRVGLAA